MYKTTDMLGPKVEWLRPNLTETAASTSKVELAHAALALFKEIRCCNGSLGTNEEIVVPQKSLAIAELPEDLAQDIVLVGLPENLEQIRINPDLQLATADDSFAMTFGRQVIEIYDGDDRNVPVLKRIYVTDGKPTLVVEYSGAKEQPLDLENLEDAVRRLPPPLTLGELRSRKRPNLSLILIGGTHGVINNSKGNRPYTFIHYFAPLPTED